MQFMTEFREVDYLKPEINKEVLLRERKRHTARRVASARYAGLSPDGGGGGVPHAGLDGGTCVGLLVMSALGFKARLELSLARFLA